MKRILGLGLAFVLLLTGSLHAQVLKNTTVGDSVRVFIRTENATRQIEGIVLALDDEAITIKGADGYRINISVDSIDQIIALVEKPERSQASPSQVIDLYSLTTDHRIRVLAHQVQREPFVGQFVDVDQQYLVLNEGKRNRIIPVDELDRLEVSRGIMAGSRPSGPIAIGGLLGFVAAGGASVAIALNSPSCTSEEEEIEGIGGLIVEMEEAGKHLFVCPIVVLFSGLGGGGLGGLIGGFIGLKIAEKRTPEVWEEIPVKASLALLPVYFSEDKYRAGISLTWKIGR